MNSPVSSTVAAVSGAAIIPGPEWTLTFVQPTTGPRAGHWILPAVPIGEGESTEQAARRAAEEEAGVRAGALAPMGIYEVRGRDTDGNDYHQVVHVHRALNPSVVPEGLPAAPSAVEQAHPRNVLPHPTDMRILNDADMADYDPDLIHRLMAADGVLMRRLDAD